MAKITILSVDKRLVTVNVLWDNGLKKDDLKIPDVPVEDFSAAQAYLFNYITLVYDEVVKADEEAKRLNPVIDPAILAAVGHTFDNDGNLIS